MSSKILLCFLLLGLFQPAAYCQQAFDRTKYRVKGLEQEAAKIEASGKPAEIKAFYEDLSKTSPSNKQVFFLYAKWLFSQGNYGEAQKSIEKAKKLDPFDKELAVLSAKINVQAFKAELKQQNEARKKEILEAGNREDILELNKGNKARAEGDLDAAIAHYSKAVDLNKSLAEANFARAEVLDYIAANLTDVIVPFEMKDFSLKPSDIKELAAQDRAVVAASGAKFAAGAPITKIKNPDPKGPSADLPLMMSMSRGFFGQVIRKKLEKQKPVDDDSKAALTAKKPAEQESFKPAAGAIVLSGAASHLPRVPKLSDAQLWALACTAIQCVDNEESLDVLWLYDPPKNDTEYRELLAGVWNISSEADLLKKLDWLENQGESQIYEEFKKAAASGNTAELKKLNLSDSEINRRLALVKKTSELLGGKKLLAWDLSRYINLCRQAALCLYFSPDQAWAKIMPAARKIQENYSSWQDFGRDFLIGREFHSLEETRKSGLEYVAAYVTLVKGKGSPWTALPWKTGLGGN